MSDTILSTDETQAEAGPAAQRQVSRDEHASRDEIVTRVFRWSLVGVAACGALVYLGWLALAPIELGEASFTRRWPSAEVEAEPSVADEFPDVPFTDITQQAGIDFVHFNGATGKLMMPENVGSGCAFFDYDNDGHQDLL